jgi:hypothetical protein
VAASDESEFEPAAGVIARILHVNIIRMIGRAGSGTGQVTNQLISPAARRSVGHQPDVPRAKRKARRSRLPWGGLAALRLSRGSSDKKCDPQNRDPVNAGLSVDSSWG